MNEQEILKAIRHLIIAEPKEFGQIVENFPVLLTPEAKKIMEEIADEYSDDEIFREEWKLRTEFLAGKSNLISSDYRL